MLYLYRKYVNIQMDSFCTEPIQVYYKGMISVPRQDENLSVEVELHSFSVIN